MPRALSQCSYTRDGRSCGRDAFRTVNGMPCCSRHWQRKLKEQLADIGRAQVVALRPTREEKRRTRRLSRA
jgi:hypothetical protein